MAPIRLWLRFRLVSPRLALSSLDLDPSDVIADEKCVIDFGGLVRKGREFAAVATDQSARRSLSALPYDRYGCGTTAFYVAITRAERILMYIAEPDQWVNTRRDFWVRTALASNSNSRELVALASGATFSQSWPLRFGH